MDKSKLSSIGDLLKTSSAQMGRMVSSKFTEIKELLQSPTPESKIVDQATAPSLESPDWGLNLRICALVNSDELSGADVVRAIKKKITGDDAHAQRLALELLEACAMNCEKVFSEIASEKVLEEMVRLVECPESERECSVRAMEMIRAWGESSELSYLPVFRHTYQNLKQRGMPSHVQDGNLPPSMQYPLESYIDQDSSSPPENYPLPDTDALRNVLPYTYGSFSIEEKKEFLEITRNSLEVLSSLINSASESEAELPKDDLTTSMLDKCKESQPVLQRIIETTSEDENLLFEALNLHDELQQVVSKFEKLEVSEPSVAQLPQESQSADHDPLPPVQTQNSDEQPEAPGSPKSEETKATTSHPPKAEETKATTSHPPNLLEGETSDNRE